MIDGGVGENEGAAAEDDSFRRNCKRECCGYRVCYTGRKRAALYMIEGDGAIT